MSFCSAVVVLENHPLALQILQDQIKAALPELPCTYAGASLAEALVHALPNQTLVVMDMDLGNGQTAAQNVIDLQSQQLQVILTSASDRTLDVASACAAGAFAFIPKRLIGTQLADAVRHLNEGQPWISPEFAAALVGDYAGELAHTELALYAGGLPITAIANRLGQDPADTARILLTQAADLRRG